MIKYRTRLNNIEALEVERETDTQVVIPGQDGWPSRHKNKRSYVYNWHDTWEAAHEFLIENAEREVETLRMRLEQAKGKLGQIKGMKPSKPGENDD